MPYTFKVRPHPLGVIVFEKPGKLGELLLPGESCCGVKFEDLQKAAATGMQIDVDDSAAIDCPLQRPTSSR